MPRFKLTIEYDGTGLAGWQRQNDQPSVQGYLEEAASRLCGQRQKVICAGRTDAGVHAIAQVVHLDTVKDMLPYNMMQGLNYHLLPLTRQVIIHKAEMVPDDFNARFSATARAYFYRIINRPARLALWENRAWHVPEKLDEGLMQSGAEILLGTHDFTSFRSTQCQANSPLRTLDVFTVKRVEDEIHLHLKARSFLHHQVRNMAGSLRMLGNGKWSVTDLQAALDAKNRCAGGATAPPQGLYLAEVLY